MSRAILQAAIGHIWTSPGIADDFATLCGFGGRFAGTQSEAAAREWLATRMQAAMAAPVLRAPVAYRGWTRGPASLRLENGRELTALGLVRTPATPPEGLTARLVDLGRGTLAEIAAAGDVIAGAIVMVQHEYPLMDGHVHRRRKYDALRNAGAVGFIIAYHVPGGPAVTGSSGDGSAGHLPSVGVSHADGVTLAACAGQAVTLFTSGVFADAIAQNLIASRNAAASGRVVLSAHYDGHDPACSAIDNASGVIAALAAAEALRAVAPDLAFDLAFFTVEEWALIGSATYLENLPHAARAAITLNVNLDSVAGGKSLTAITGGFPGLADFVTRTTAAIGLPTGIHDGFMANSDHANFIRHGIPAFRLCAGFNEPDSLLRTLLTADDTPDKVLPHELKTAAMLAVALVLGERPPGQISSEAGRKLAGY